MTFHLISSSINFNGHLEISSTAFRFKALEIDKLVKFLCGECLCSITDFKSTVSSSLEKALKYTTLVYIDI